MKFMERVRGTQVEKDSAAVFWLGQAGFLIKTAEGRQIVIDPYFSDCVERLIPEEGLGFTGAKQGIAAHCVCLLERT